MTTGSLPLIAVERALIAVVMEADPARLTIPELAYGWLSIPRTEERPTACGALRSHALKSQDRGDRI